MLVVAENQAAQHSLGKDTHATFQGQALSNRNSSRQTQSKHPNGSTGSQGPPAPTCSSLHSAQHTPHPHTVGATLSLQDAYFCEAPESADSTVHGLSGRQEWDLGADTGVQWIKPQPVKPASYSRPLAPVLAVPFQSSSLIK